MLSETALVFVVGHHHFSVFSVSPSKNGITLLERSIKERASWRAGNPYLKTMQGCLNSKANHGLKGVRDRAFVVRHTQLRLLMAICRLVISKMPSMRAWLPHRVGRLRLKLCEFQ